MVRRALRAALFAVVAVVVWTVARPARAAPAPFCDDRGASALAAPPALEAPDDAIRRAVFSGCDHDKLESGISVRSPHERVASQSDDSSSCWRSDGTVPSPALEATPGSVFVRLPRIVGVSSRVERPPRA
jgi:hypothetical protein